MSSYTIKTSGITEEEKAALYWLVSRQGLGAISIRRLYEQFGSFKLIYNIEEKALAEAGILKKNQLESLIKGKAEYGRCCDEYLSLPDNKICCVTPFEKTYPSRLKEIHDYPMMLFQRGGGGFPNDEVPSVAIVGARGCSAYGEQITEEFARVLALEGVQIISGLAVGIDGAAHRGCLKNRRGQTYAVLGCSVNICYPTRHYLLYEAMQEHGGIISEYPLHVEPEKRNFPMRNRIISGLSDLVLVTEAKEKSGSLITTEFALDQGRDVFAVPGRITDHLSKGCNALISQGAQPALSPDDILEYLGVRFEKKLQIKEKNVMSLAKKEKLLYSCLDFSPRHLDQISSASGLPVSECMGILMELELAGFVYRSSNQYYGRKL